MIDAILQDAYILLFGMVILLFSSIFMHYTNRIFNLNSISIASVWYFAYVVIIFIPSFWTFYARTGHYRFNYIYTMTSPLVTIPFGILLVNGFLKYKPEEIQQYHSAAIQDRPRSFIRIVNYTFLFIIGFALFCSWCIEQKGNPIPLLFVLTHPADTKELLMLREYSFKLLDSPIRYLYHLTRDFLFPLLMLVAFSNYYCSRSRIWFFFFVVSSIFGLFYAGANIAKSPVFSVVLLMLLNLFILKGAKLFWWQVMIGIVLCLFFPLFVLMSNRGGLYWDNFQPAFQLLMERIFLAPSSIVYYGYEIVPERYPFQMGRCMGAIARLLRLAPTDIGEYTAWYIMGDGYGTTSVSGAFVTELWGDFGYVGVIMGGILVGILMQWLHVSIIRGPKTIMAIATYVLFIYFFSTLTYLQIASALILSGAPLLWILYKIKLIG